MNFFESVRQVIRKMFGGDKISEQIKSTAPVSSKMKEALELWESIYKNKAPWLCQNVKSLNLGACIASEFARLTTLEMKSVVSGGVLGEYINNIYSGFIQNLRPHVEKGCVFGGIAIKPFLSDGRIYFDFATPNMFYPTSFDSDGEITSCVFVSRKIIGNRFYTKFEEHIFKDNSEEIKNTAFISRSSAEIGQSTTLSSVPDWADLPPQTIISNITRPLFAYFKMPFANEIDEESPLGVSVYSRAVEILEEADKQWSRLLWEFAGGELAIDADESILRREDEDGNNYNMPELSDRLFRRLSVSGASREDFYKVYSPPLREQSFINGLEAIKRSIEFNCSLAYGTLSNPQNVDKTAEEIKASKQRSYSAVSDIQKALEKALEHVVYIISIWCRIGNLCENNGDYDISFDWDDSIIADRQREFTEKQTLTTLGIMKPFEFRMWYFGESEEQAKAVLAVSDELGNEE